MYQNIQQRKLLQLYKGNYLLRENIKKILKRNIKCCFFVLRINFFKIISILLFLRGNYNYIYAKPIEFSDGFEIGISEKGLNLNLIKDISNKNQLVFGLHYFEGNISELEYSLIEPVPILYSSKGLEISLKRFITGSVKESGFFGKVGVGLSSIKASSNIDLSSQIYDAGVFTLTCRECGNLIVETNNNSYKFIPSLSLGWKQKINQNFSFSISAGLQYFDMPDVISKSSKGQDFPPYVKSKINSIIENTNQELDKYGNIIPTISISSNYVF